MHAGIEEKKEEDQEKNEKRSRNQFETYEHY